MKFEPWWKKIGEERALKVTHDHVLLAMVKAIAAAAYLKGVAQGKLEELNKQGFEYDAAMGALVRKKK